MSRYVTLPSSAFFAFVLATCSNPFTGSDCVSIGVAGITVTVVDAGTNLAPVAVPVVRIEDGNHVEEYATPFPRSDPPQYSGAVERPGIYRVVVSAAGYQNQLLNDVTVTRGGRCSYLSGVQLKVPLKRSM